ncbi:MAG: hypothetical protein Q4P24_16215 [Rhodobacterales bacterium]|nr:hypothetical protein [Rhodobacterales bacterium]
MTTTWYLIGASLLTTWALYAGHYAAALAAGVLTVAAAGLAFYARKVQP